MFKKGFLFVVTIFLILTYILLSISVWVKSIETSERYYSEFYKESNLELVSSQITHEKVSDVTHTILSRSLYKLSDHAASNPVIVGPVGSENSNIVGAMRTLFIDGNASGSFFQTSIPLSIAPTSLKSWINGLNQSLYPSGAFVSDYSVTNFTLSQSQFDRVDYRFDLILKISDYSNISSVTKNYVISDSILINGLVDPALLRESTSASRPIHRQFFFNGLYPEPSSVSVYKHPTASLGGQGWLYAPLAAANPAVNPELSRDISPANRSTYILVGTYLDIVSVEGYSEYAGYIVTSAPGTGSSCDSFTSERNTFKPLNWRRDRSGVCTPGVDYANGNPTSKPFIVVPGFSASDSRFNCPGSQKCALINSHYSASDLTSTDISRKITHLSDSHVGIFAIESVRDFLLCGYYLPSATSPSFMQRLFSDSYNRSSPLGIETFVVGEYSDIARLSSRSRVDTELFNPVPSGIKLKGTVGCKDQQSCSSDLTTGHFALSADAIRRYNLEALSCALGARC